MALTATLALLSGLASVASCQRRETAERDTTGLRLTVLDEGGGDRRALRYPAEPPAEQRMSLTLRLAMKMEVPGSPIPPVTMPGLRLLFDVQGRRRGDLLQLEFSVTDADLTGAEAAHPTAVASMRKGLAALVGVTGVVSLDDRGMPRGGSFGLPDGLGPELTQFMSSAEMALRQLAVPLPEQKIGVGAKWQVEQRIDQAGVTVQQRTTYELLAAEGARVQLRVQTVQSAEAQRADLPGLPSGVTAEVLSLRGAGAGELEVDLRRLVPTSAREEIETDISFAIQQGQNQRTMSLTSSAGLEIQAL